MRVARIGPHLQAMRFPALFAIDQRIAFEGWLTSLGFMGRHVGDVLIIGSCTRCAVDDWVVTDGYGVTIVSDEIFKKNYVELP